jgi:paraquat-inducible protein B
LRRAAWRVGAFALAGTALLALAVVVAAGRWFVASERALMRFQTSVYGLQVGAPAVFRGVRIGQVDAIGLEPMEAGAVAIPVTVRFDRALLHGLVGSGEAGATPLQALVARGLYARLATQSLLTGQLYVDLDLDRARASATPARAGALPVVPTAPTRLQTLQSQFEGLDLARIGEDLAVIASSARRLMEGEAPGRVLERAAAAAESLERLAVRLEAELGPLTRETRSVLAQARHTLDRVGTAAAEAGVAAGRVGTAAGRLDGLAAEGGPVLAQVQRAAEALAGAADSLRAAAGEDSALRLQAERALQDVSRAARALRELGETLERHPDALLRGREPSR